MTEQFKGALGTIMGTFYPTDYVIAVIDDPEQAQQAARELSGTGCNPEYIGLFSGQQVLANHQAYLKQRNMLERIEGLFPSDEGEALQSYLEAAEAGASFIAVHTPNVHDVERYRGILSQHHARSIKHYGKWVLTDLSAA